MSAGLPDWLEVSRGHAPLLVSLPHTGTWIPQDLEDRMVSPWLARKDTDWYVDRLYDFASDLGATVVRTLVSRAVVDVNRDPSGASLYPGQATTDLCPTTTFDGEPIYLHDGEPGAKEIAARVDRWFVPYHVALQTEAARLACRHKCVVIYDCHSIRSILPRLFEGTLPVFNIGCNGLTTCDHRLAASVAETCRASGHSEVVDGRFKGGFITRRFGRPDQGLHAIQMEIACRGYLAEPAEAPSQATWPPPYDADYARPLRDTLREVLDRCLTFAKMTRELA